jgi:hypothetical protein
MGKGVVLISELRKSLRNWEFLAVDAYDQFGGIITGWNNNITLTNSFTISLGLCTKIFNKSLGHVFTLINVYGPYEKKHRFWESLFNLQCLKADNFILGGDLKFTLSQREVWGDSERVDHLADFFANKLEACGMVDVEPLDLHPMWSNNRARREIALKCLDRFVVNNSILHKEVRYRSWVYLSQCLDQFPIVLQLNLDDPSA